MSETVPDPATRDLLAEAFEAGLSLPAGGPHFDAWLAAKFPPPLPAEPLDGAVLRGKANDVWQRDDDGGDTDGLHWWVVGGNRSHTWVEAYEKGADPTRRLVELPDAGDAEAIEVLNEEAYQIACRAKSCPGVYPDTVNDATAWVVRALAERGETLVHAGQQASGAWWSTWQPGQQERDDAGTEQS